MESKTDFNKDFSEVMKIILLRYKELYRQKSGTSPVINYGWTGKMIKELLKSHSPFAIIRIMELYYENEFHSAFHLPTILSSWSFNKYLPQAKLDPRLFSDAEEYNKEIY